MQADVGVVFSTRPPAIEKIGDVVTFATGGFAPGEYTANVSIASTGASGSPQTIKVVLIVTPAQLAATVIEYVNTADFPDSPGGHFFYSSDPAEQAAVDAGAACRFVRTNRKFLTGGTSPVCRFYGSMAPGPNSHFFTVDVAECNALKEAQVTPTPLNVQQWNFERISYNTTPASVAASGVRSCPAGTLPLYPAYNNAFPLSGPKNPWDSNHRFTPQLADITGIQAVGQRVVGRWWLERWMRLTTHSNSGQTHRLSLSSPLCKNDCTDRSSLSILRTPTDSRTRGYP